MPMSGPRAFGDRKEDPGCPFTNQCPFRFFLVRPNELEVTMPPSSSCRPVWQGGISSLMVCQLTVVHHDIDGVKVHQMSTLPQDIFKDQLPVGMADLPVTSYSKGAVSPNLAPGSPATNLALVSKLPLLFFV